MTAEIWTHNLSTISQKPYAFHYPTSKKYYNWKDIIHFCQKTEKIVFIPIHFSLGGGCFFTLLVDSSHSPGISHPLSHMHFVLALHFIDTYLGNTPTVMLAALMLLGMEARIHQISWILEMFQTKLGQEVKNQEPRRFLKSW